MTGRTPPPIRDVQQLRGLEGNWVKAKYLELANANGVEWYGRSTKAPINEAISFANSMLYGLTEAAILALGYCPALGVVHSGDRRSLVFDIADTLKFSTVVPLAFELVAESDQDVRGRVRRACRDRFRRHNLIASIAAVIEEMYAP